MTREEAYELLEVKAKFTNWNDIESIKEYNAFAREIRHSVYESEGKNDD